MRAHALPLPYVTIPSVSFLVYLSPLAYLSLLRTRPASLPALPNLSLPVLDIPFQHLRRQIASHPQAPGVTLAALVLATEGPSLPSQSSSMNVEVFATRPTFILLEGNANVDFVFPLPLEISVSNGKHHRWFLDFTDGGKFPGVVMGQSKMREIETIVNPLGAGFDHVDGISSITFGSGSWVDLLVSLLVLSNSKTANSPISLSSCHQILSFPQSGIHRYMCVLIYALEASCRS